MFCLAKISIVEENENSNRVRSQSAQKSARHLIEVDYTYRPTRIHSAVAFVYSFIII